METKNILVLLSASVLMLALLGCVQEMSNIPACKGEGESIPVIASPPECCSGLILIPPKEQGIIGISGYCTARCGNSVCDRTTESSYNCLEDCEGCPETCVPAPPYCPSGILIVQEQTDNCGCPLPPTCCGDGTCEGKENKENCPVDCITVQVVGPDYYDSEEQAFDALNQELGQMEDISMQELESMLGE